MVAQHMQIRHRGASDHFAVWADLNFESPHCTPASAKGVAPSAPDWCGREKMSFKYPGGMQWVRFDVPGSYIFTNDAAHHLQIYEAHNISDPLPDFARKVVDVSVIPGTNPAWGDGLPKTGRKFHIPNAPFFVRLTHPNNLTGSTDFGWKLCRGRSPFDAIILPSHDSPLIYTWPKKAPVEEEAWFEAFICESVDGQRHTSTFIVENPAAGQINVRIKDSAQALLKETGWTSDNQVSVKFADKGGRSVFFTVERSAATTQSVQVHWRTELTFLTGAREISGSNTHKIGLFCVDETGIDWLGSDEAVMELIVHGKKIRGFPVDRAYWDADSDDAEYFAIRQIPYIDGMEVKVIELEPAIMNNDIGTKTIAPLPQADKGDNPNSNKTTRKFRMSVGSGEYELRCCLCRNPVGSSQNGIP
jgi:hypothetical protein